MYLNLQKGVYLEIWNKYFSVSLCFECQQFTDITFGTEILNDETLIMNVYVQANISQTKPKIEIALISKFTKYLLNTFNIESLSSFFVSKWAHDNLLVKMSELLSSLFWSDLSESLTEALL